MKAWHGVNQQNKNNTPKHDECVTGPPYVIDIRNRSQLDFPFLIGRLILPFVARQAVLAVPVEKIVVVKETQVLNANRIFAPLALHCAAAKA